MAAPSQSGVPRLGRVVAHAVYQITSMLANIPVRTYIALIHSDAKPMMYTGMALSLQLIILSTVVTLSRGNNHLAIQVCV